MSFLQSAGGLIQGGFDAVGNIFSAATKPITTFASGFFPPQRTQPIKSQITKPMPQTGLTYMPTLPELASFGEKWVGEIADTAPTLEVRTVVKPESNWLSGITSGLGQGLADVFGQVKSSVVDSGQLGNIIMTKWGLVETADPNNLGDGGNNDSGFNPFGWLPWAGQGETGGQPKQTYGIGYTLDSARQAIGTPGMIAIGAAAVLGIILIAKRK